MSKPRILTQAHWRQLLIEANESHVKTKDVLSALAVEMDAMRAQLTEASEFIRRSIEVGGECEARCAQLVKELDEARHAATMESHE
jgi:hypothetical protein